MNISNYEFISSQKILADNILSTSSSRSRLSLFQDLIGYFVKLRRDGRIDDEMFKFGVTELAAAFVEAEISKRVDNTLRNENFINKLTKVLYE